VRGAETVLFLVVLGTVVAALLHAHGALSFWDYAAVGPLSAAARITSLRFEMPAAVGTSLLVIAINSAAAFAARLSGHVSLDRPLLAEFTAAVLAGVLAGNRVASRPTRSGSPPPSPSCLSLWSGTCSPAACPGWCDRGRSVTSSRWSPWSRTNAPDPLASADSRFEDMKRIVILGGGTGGTITANRLRRVYGTGEAEIVVVDQDDEHVYQPGLLFVPFGLADPARLVRPRRRQLHAGVGSRRAGIDHVDLPADQVHLEDGTVLGYDVLVIATGARLLPEETEALLGPGWMKDVFTFYTLPGAAALRTALDRFDGGRLVVNVVDMPVKCPVAPLEFCFLADRYFRRREIRSRVQLSYVTPLDGAFTKPVCNRELSGLLTGRDIELVTEFNTGTVQDGTLVSYDDREVPFDLAVVVPVHGGAAYVDRSPGLGDELGFIPVDRGTLQATAKPNVFAIGDATDVPTSKAGSVAHFEGEIVTDGIRAYLAGQPVTTAFDGHTNCFIETGGGKALLIDFNYDTEPLTGHYPARLGLPLLRESRLNHLGKLAFQQLYWHSLLPGRDLPGIGAAMPRRGKKGLPASA